MLDHTERRDHAPTRPNVYEALNLSPSLRVSYQPMPSSPSAIRISTDTPQHTGTAPLPGRPMGA